MHISCDIITSNQSPILPSDRGQTFVLRKLSLSLFLLLQHKPTTFAILWEYYSLIWSFFFLKCNHLINTHEKCITQRKPLPIVTNACQICQVFGNLVAQSPFVLRRRSTVWEAVQSNMIYGQVIRYPA